MKSSSKRIWEAGVQLQESAQGLASDLLRIPQAEKNANLDYYMLAVNAIDIIDSTRRLLRGYFPELKELDTPAGAR